MAPNEKHKLLITIKKKNELALLKLLKVKLFQGLFFFFQSGNFENTSADDRVSQVVQMENLHHRKNPPAISCACRFYLEVNAHTT